MCVGREREQERDGGRRERCVWREREREREREGDLRALSMPDLDRSEGFPVSPASAVSVVVP